MGFIELSLMYLGLYEISGSISDLVIPRKKAVQYCIEWGCLEGQRDVLRGK